MQGVCCRSIIFFVYPSTLVVISETEQLINRNSATP